MVNNGAKAWDETAHLLQRDGQTLQIGRRRFWDFSDPWVHACLAERMIQLLKDNNIGYLKIDYNDSIGLGHDGAESPGEALRQHLDGVQTFLRRLRRELPDLVIENCSSGGHRIEPSMLALTALSSFSDAHESLDIPIIAANLYRVILPRQNQVWAVLHAADDHQRLAYSLAAAFLGRMCLSGEMHALSPAAAGFAKEAIALYRELSPILVADTAAAPRRIAEFGPSWQHPQGRQAVLFHDPAGGRAFVVWHAFAEPGATLEVALPAGRDWRITRDWSDLPNQALIESGNRLQIQALRPFSGGVVVVN